MFRSLLQTIAFCALLAAGSARAQWVVYEAVFQVEEPASLNFDPYTGAYIIAPVDGGKASFVFTTESEGRFYSIAENTGRYFLAANKESRRAVLSAISQNGTARAMYQASGLLNGSMAFTVGNERKGARVPNELTGTMLASDDESLAGGPASDGSIGMVGSAMMTAVLRLDLSRILNQKENTMRDGVELITSLLDKYGYVPDGSQAAAAANMGAQPEAAASSTSSDDAAAPIVPEATK